jgi:hypothetical protein
MPWSPMTKTRPSPPGAGTGRGEPVHATVAGGAGVGGEGGFGEVFEAGFVGIGEVGDAGEVDGGGTGAGEGEELFELVGADVGEDAAVL